MWRVWLDVEGVARWGGMRGLAVVNKNGIARTFLLLLISWSNRYIPHLKTSCIH